MAGLADGLSQRAAHMTVPTHTANSSHAPTASVVNGVGIHGGRTGSRPNARRPNAATTPGSRPPADTPTTRPLEPSPMAGLGPGSPGAGPAAGAGRRSPAPTAARPGSPGR